MKRIEVCEHTGFTVVQVFTDGEWLCLHNETPEQDQAEVETFKQENDMSTEVYIVQSNGENIRAFLDREEAEEFSVRIDDGESDISIETITAWGK
jgi:hypothetical protein